MQSSCDGRRLITGRERGDSQRRETLWRSLPGSCGTKEAERTIQRDKHNNKTYFMFPWRGLQIQGPRIVHAGLLPVLYWHSWIKQSHRLCYQLHLCFFLHNRTICWRKRLCLSRVLKNCTVFRGTGLKLPFVRVYEFHWKYIRNVWVTILTKC